MAKKNKKNTKINQQIRRFFDDDPFDVGIERVEAKTLSELFATLGIYEIEHNKALMVKTLRMIWSEAQSEMRRDILHFFQNEGKVYKSEVSKEPFLEKEEKLASLLESFDITEEEYTALLDAFKTVRIKKITPTKIENKLEHIRFESKKQLLEKELEGFFDEEDRFEFNASFVYALYDQHFHKILTIHTKAYRYEFLRDTPFDQIVETIVKAKQEAIVKKQQQIDKFINNLKSPHPYLSIKDIVNALRAAPPHSPLSYPMIPQKILYAIIEKKLDTESIEIHTEELLLRVKSSIVLPYSSLEFSYIVEFSLMLDEVLEPIWNGKRFSFDAQLHAIKEEQERTFLQTLHELMEVCSGYGELLRLNKEDLYQKVYPFLLDLLGANLVITPKIFRKVSRRFLYSIQEELIKKQRQELLARTIRDFKNLFPIARGMRRKLTLHIGPTNSGKTYAAMQKLKEADTGYYLAPLRLLALEGYETLKKENLEVSLITGEEQIIDEEATHISSTIEMMNYEVDVDVCVIDEVQMLHDRDRGWAWVNAIIGAPASEVIMTGSENVKDAIIALAEYLGESLEIVECTRKNELVLLDEPVSADEVEEATAIIAFSRRDVLRLKQRFSSQYKVSVVYGNLSPEVRREEARRFREGETQILVATDAIAMGMNLPIKTVLFSKAQKFDGIMQRDLFASEILQIAGRAGRYGLHEKGYVGALDKQSLKVIRRNFHKTPKPIVPPFKVMASLEHIKLVATILEERSLEIILQFFIENMEFNGPFYAARLDDMLEASKIVDQFDLDIATKYHLACAPLTLKSPYIVGAYERYIYALEQNQEVHYHPPKLSGDYAKTAEELLHVEDMVKEISLYLWLSYRFGEYFIDVEGARRYRDVLNSYIERSLQQTQLARSCKLCGTALPLQSRYNICQKCFRKNYTRKGRYHRS